MCGLVAVVDLDGGLNDGSVAPAMTVLRPRGPDGEGTWLSPTRRAVLGHTRLAINDPHGGAQPMGRADDGLWLVSNGELYDHLELGDELTRRGVHLRSRSDAEVALHQFAEHGEAAATRWRGELAVVVWDERRGRLTAIRDRFGVKPLYHARLGRRVLIASEITALLAMGVDAEWDVPAFADHLQVAMGPTATPVRAVRQVPPGCMLRVDTDGVHVRRYWDIDYPSAHELGEVDERERPAHEAAVAAAMMAAVHRRTEVAQPLSCYLSGGLDSAAVLALAARNHEVEAYTAGFDHPGFDETSRARRTAEHLGVRHHVVSRGPGGHLERLAETVRAGEMVPENAHGAARLDLARAVGASGRRVALAGEGGDETLLGYPQLLKDLELTLDPAAMERTRRHCAALAETPHAPPHLRSMVRTLGFVPSWVVERHATLARPIRHLLDPDLLRLTRRRDSTAELLSDVGHRLTGRLPVHQSMHLFARSRLVNYILSAERLDARHGVEVRMPLLDEDLFDVVRRTPPQWYASAGRGKQLLRAAVGPALPAEVRGGVKRGFFAPPELAEQTDVNELRQVITPAALDASPLFDRRAVSAWLDGLSGMPAARRAVYDPIVHLVAGSILLGETFQQVGHEVRGAGARA